MCCLYTSMNRVSICWDNSLAPILAPSHYLTQCWIIINWILKNKFHWHLNQNIALCIHQNASDNIVCEMAATLSRGRWVNVEQTSVTATTHIPVDSVAPNYNLIRIDVAWPVTVPILQWNRGMEIIRFYDIVLCFWVEAQNSSRSAVNRCKPLPLDLAEFNVQELTSVSFHSHLYSPQRWYYKSNSSGMVLKQTDTDPN